MLKKLIPEFSIFFIFLICFFITDKILFPIQSKLFGSENIIVGALIFLPHGVRVISTAVYGLRSIIPLLCAHFLALLMYVNFFGLHLTVILTFISTFCVWLTILIIFRSKNGLSLDQITFKNIILITFVSSTINSFGHAFAKHLFLIQTHLSLINKELFYYMIGDFLGTLLLFFLYIKFIKKYFTKSLEQTNTRTKI